MITLVFSLKQKTLGKKTFDNRVKHIPRSEQTHEIYSKPNIRKKSLTRKQDKNLSQKHKKLIKTVAAGKIGFLK